MIAYVDTPPSIEPRDGGFLVTIKSGGNETAFMLTLHAMTVFCGKGMGKLKQAQAAQFEPTPFSKKGPR